MTTRRAASLIVARWMSTKEDPKRLFSSATPDRAFVQDLVYTVIRRLRTLRFVLGQLVQTWPKGELESLLYVGAAQILFMKDVPDFAAVNETVNAAKGASRGHPLDRLVNAVLRNLVRRKDEFLAQLATEDLGTRESYPNALVTRWLARYGEVGAEKMARWHNEPAPMYLAYPPDAGEEPFVLLPHGQKVTSVSGYEQGAFLVQDPATAHAVDLLDVQEGVHLLDYCAAPGGKTVQCAWRLKGTGRLVAHEVNPRRLALLKENLVRMHLPHVEVVSSLSNEKELFSRVLVDAPCSNSGVLRRRPDARWRWTREHLTELVSLQAQILQEASRFVQVGGLLVYSTCSNEPEENEEQVEAFLAKNSNFEKGASHESIPFESGFDGAFACVLRRKASSNGSLS